MVKNANIEIQESEDFSTETIAFQLQNRPKIATSPLQVVTVLDGLVTLDAIKGGLVGVRGGRTQDQAFIIMENDIDTELLYCATRRFFNGNLIRPGCCSKFYQRLLFEATRKASKKEKLVMEDGTMVECNVETESVNRNYVGDRYVMCIALPSAASAVYFVHSYLEVVLDYLKVAYYPAEIVMDAYTKCAKWPVENFVSYAKYCTAYPFAKYLKQEDLPSKPLGLKNYKVFDGIIGRMIRIRFVSVNDKCSRFYFSILQGVKRACNIVPYEYIVASKIKHIQILTKPSESVDSEVMKKFDMLTSRLMKGVSLTKRRVLSFTEPSKNASYEATRRDGGQDSTVRKGLGIPSATNKVYFDQGFDVSKKVDHVNGVDRVNSYELVEPEEYYVSREHDELYLMTETDKGIEELRGIKHTMREKEQLLKEAIKSFEGKPLYCNIVPLSEPLKVRTISAGNGVPYYLSKPFQKTIWAWLRRYSQFIVIGEPLSRTHLRGILDREHELILYLQRLKDSSVKTDALVRAATLFQLWLSGDYSAATDNLKIEYTLEAFDIVSAALCEQCRRSEAQELPFLQAYLDFVRKALEPHRLVYSDKDRSLRDYCLLNGIEHEYDPDTGLLYTDQRNGQLMGSPISFPFLCMINLVGYWISLNEYLGVYVPLKFLPLLVNGDDILFRTNTDHQKIWLRIITEFGFKLSLGKNYTHPTLLTINSELYEYSRFDVLEFKKLEFFNVGLLIAQSKGRLADPRRKLPLRDLYEESVGHAQDKLRAHRRFLHYNKEQIQLCTDKGKYNLFLPVTSGGLGFPYYPEVSEAIHITKFQRRFASFLLFKIQEGLGWGVYRQRYVSALVTDTTPIKSLIRRSGFPILKLGGLVPDEGWTHFVPPDPITMAPFSAPQEIVTAPNSEYRYPAKSVLRQFNSIQHKLRTGLIDDDILTRAMSDAELLSSAHSFIHRLENTFEEASRPRRPFYFGTVDGVPLTDPEQLWA